MNNYNLKKSVTAVLQCDDEVLILQRAYHLRAFPGFTSFVGGKVDPDDNATAILHGYSHIADELLNALLREINEEIELDLVERSAIIESIECAGVATTPKFQPHRFENHYFIIKLKEKIVARNDAGEIRHSAWVSLDDFFKDYELGKHLIVPPSKEVLRRIKENRLSDSSDLNLIFDEGCVPEIEFINGISILMPLSNTLPPAMRTNCFYMGGRVKLLVDPSPKNEVEFNKLIKTLNKRKIDLIFITHHHPDHHEFAPQLAQKLKVPLAMSQHTYDLCLSQTDENYFDGQEVQIKKDGDVISDWCGQDILVQAVPGHASGQLALTSRNNSFAIVSDLIQTIGTVVVAPPNGDMSDYFKSMNTIINANYQYIFPSHGLPMGGSHKLIETLEHRQSRENQIKVLLKNGKSILEMRESIYPQLDEKLYPFAEGTIQAHIKKIESEG